MLPDRIRLGDPLIGHFESKRLRAFVLNVRVGVILIMTRRGVFTERGRRSYDDWRAWPTCGSTGERHGSVGGSEATCAWLQALRRPPGRLDLTCRGRLSDRVISVDRSVLFILSKTLA